MYVLKAWSSLVYQLIPNVQELEEGLKRFADVLECDEVLLLECATLLVISSYVVKKDRDGKRFEKVSNVIKGFKLSCRLIL